MSQKPTFLRKPKKEDVDLLSLAALVVDDTKNVNIPTSNAPPTNSLPLTLGKDKIQIPSKIPPITSTTSIAKSNNDSLTNNRQDNNKSTHKNKNHNDNKSTDQSTSSNINDNNKNQHKSQPKQPQPPPANSITTVTTVTTTSTTPTPTTRVPVAKFAKKVPPVPNDTTTATTTTAKPGVITSTTTGPLPTTKSKLNKNKDDKTITTAVTATIATPTIATPIKTTSTSSTTTDSTKEKGRKSNKKSSTTTTATSSTTTTPTVTAAVVTAAVAVPVTSTSTNNNNNNTNNNNSTTTTTTTTEPTPHKSRNKRNNKSDTTSTTSTTTTPITTNSSTTTTPIIVTTAKAIPVVTSEVVKSTPITTSTPTTTATVSTTKSTPITNTTTTSIAIPVTIAKAEPILSKPIPSKSTPSTTTTPTTTITTTSTSSTTTTKSASSKSKPTTTTSTPSTTTTTPPLPTSTTTPDTTTFHVLHVSKSALIKLGEEIALTESNIFPTKGNKRASVFTTECPPTKSSIDLLRNKLTISLDPTSEQYKTRIKYLPIELQCMYNNGVSFIQRIDERIITLRPKYWSTDLALRPKLPLFKTIIDKELLELVNVLNLILKTLFRIDQTIIDFVHGIDAVQKVLQQFHTTPIIYKHLEDYVDTNALNRWPILVKKTPTFKLHQIVSYSTLKQSIKNNNGPFLPFEEYNINYFLYLKTKLSAMFDVFKEYCNSTTFQKFTAKHQSNTSTTSATTTTSSQMTTNATTTSNNNNNNNIKDSKSTNQKHSQQSQQQSTSATLVTTSKPINFIDFSEFERLKSQTNQQSQQDIAEIDPRYFGYSTPFKLTLTGLPYFMTLPLLHNLIKTTPSIPIQQEQQQQQQQQDNNKSSTSTSQIESKPCTYDRLWLKQGKKLDLTGLSYESTTAFLTFTTYDEFILFYNTFNNYEYYSMIPNSTQIKRFILLVQLPLNSYVPLSALDGEDPTLIQPKPTPQPPPSSQSNKKGMKNHDQQQQQQQPILTKEEEQIVSQTRWLTTSHFKDFLSDVLNDIKNAQMTSTFSQFHDHRSATNNHQKEKIQLVGSAALVVELEEKRRIKLAEQDALEKKLKRTQKGRQELAKQIKQHDPLSGLSAAFGYGLGVGRTGDIAQMSLPIIDQLILSTQQRK